MGQIGAAMKNPNTMAPDPSGFNKAEWATRIGGGAAQGLGKGMQSQQPPQQSQGQSINPMQFVPQQQAPDFLSKINSNFYGGQ